MRIAPGTTPASVKYNGRFVSCTPRNQPLPAMMSSVNGMAIASMCSHWAAAAAVAGSPESTRPICSAKSHTIEASSMPTPRPTHDACTPSATALSRCPDPKRREARAVVP